MRFFGKALAIIILTAASWALVLVFVGISVWAVRLVMGGC